MTEETLHYNATDPDEIAAIQRKRDAIEKKQTSVANKPYAYKLTHVETGLYFIGHRYANWLSADEDLLVYLFPNSDDLYDLMERDGISSLNKEILYEGWSTDDAYWTAQNIIDECYGDPLCLNKIVNKRKDSEKARLSGINKARKQRTSAPDKMFFAHLEEVKRDLPPTLEQWAAVCLALKLQWLSRSKWATKQDLYKDWLNRHPNALLGRN